MATLLDTIITIPSGQLYTSAWAQPGNVTTASASIEGQNDGAVDAWLEWTDDRNNPAVYLLGDDVFRYVHGPNQPWKLQGTETKRARWVRLRLQNFSDAPDTIVRLIVWT